MNYAKIKDIILNHGDEYYVRIETYHRKCALLHEPYDTYVKYPTHMTLRLANGIEYRCLAPKSHDDWKSYFKGDNIAKFSTFYVEELWHIEEDGMLKRVYKRGGYRRKRK